MIKKLIATAAGAGLVVAPVAAQAGTRSADAGVSLSSISRAGASIGAAEGDVRPLGLAWLFPSVGFIALAVTVVSTVESGATDRSPGT